MTTGRDVEFHPHAIEEALAARTWYQERSELAALAFAQEIDRAVEAIQEAPKRWPEYKAGTRRFLLRRFPFFLVYRITEYSIQVVAVAHGRRKPAYWGSR